MTKLEKLKDARTHVRVAYLVADGWFYPRLFALAERYLNWRIERLQRKLGVSDDRR